LRNVKLKELDVLLLKLRLNSKGIKEKKGKRSKKRIV